MIGALRDLAAHCLEIVQHSCVEGEDDTLLKTLVNVVEKAPKWVRSQISQLVE